MEYSGKIEYFKVLKNIYSVKESFLGVGKVNGSIPKISKMFFIDEYSKVLEKRKKIEELIERKFTLMSSVKNINFFQIILDKTSNASLINTAKKITDYIEHE
jgi:hypothetical protein